MYRTAELGRKIPKKEFEERELVLRQELLELQQELLNQADFPVIVVMAGVDGAGKGATVNMLNEWMDPRWLVTSAYGEPSDEERQRPTYWRFWRDLPPKGRIGLFLSSWYSRPVLDHVYNDIGANTFSQHLDRILAFEKELTDDGAVILKFWMHLSRDEQKRRLKCLEKDPLTSWRVTDTDWKNWKLYDSFIEVGERTIMRTSTGLAPWTIVEGMDHRYACITVGEMIRDTIRRKLEESKLAREVKAKLQADSSEEEAPVISDDEAGNIIQEEAEPPITVLSVLEMSKTLTKSSYKSQLKKYQAELNLLHRRALKKGVSTIMVCEGPDAAGKGGAIRRVTAALDARNFRVLPFAAPTDEESAQHYLWRFWRHLSRAGRLTIFDRSWYGRVLVERVEGFATEDEWRRAYAEINDFEEQLTEHGIVLLKYWIHITEEEQLARFEAREQTPHKRWKLTDEDWRNREKWHDYSVAVHDMVQHTDTRSAQWTLVEGNDKRYARIKVLKTLCEGLEDALGKE
ncbi:MAG: polyphosphate:AMP phosphotransferase [Gammaproteobacteria bacterium]|nr:polyphosphate:AMP phosphotransferase [Gammaproteobacteria bacterium]